MQGDIRVTGRIVSSGQPRPYADSATTAFVMFERHGWGQKDFTPYPVTEEVARRAASGLMIGYVPNTRAECTMPFQSYLAYFRPVDPAEEGRADIWEFRVVTPFTD